MTLRRKLATTFTALGLMTLLVVAVTAWSTVQWAKTESDLQEHYERSLLLQNIRALTFQATLEVPEGLTGDDPDARQDFEETMKPAREDFEQWATLADTDAERQEVQGVRRAFESIIDGSHLAFDLMDEGKTAEADRVFDQRLEDKDVEAFESITAKAESVDEQRRAVIREQTHGDRQTVEIMLGIAAFGAVALMLLLVAYLLSDLFSPLRQLRNALRGVRQGDRGIRLDEDRSDEIGEINHEFNKLAAAIAVRDRVDAGAVDRPGQPESDDAQSVSDASGVMDGAGEWTDQPTRVALQRLVTQMQALTSESSGTPDRDRVELSATLSELAATVSQLSKFGYPVDLHLEPVDLPSLVYEAVRKFHPELTARGVSLDLDLAPGIHHVSLDRLKFQESVSELIHHALASLPDQGGTLGLRLRTERVGGVDHLSVEVADDGSGATTSVIDRAFGTAGEANRRTGMGLVRAVIRQHGGRVDIETTPGEGTVARILVPMRD